MSPTNERAQLLRELLLRQILDDAEQCWQIGYDPSVFIEMVRNYGPVEACSRVIMDPMLPHGFVDLWRSNRFELTVEALVLRDRFKCLFADSVLVRARKRLADCGPSLVPKAIQ
jgi:hypothetical protein